MATLWHNLRSRLGLDGPQLPPQWVRAAETSEHVPELLDLLKRHGKADEAELELECALETDSLTDVVVRSGDRILGQLRDEYAQQYAALIDRHGGEVRAPCLIYLPDPDEQTAPELLLDLPDPEDLT